MNVRRLRPGDEHVVEALATRGSPVRAAALLADDNTDVAQAWVLTDRANLPAMEFYRSAGGIDPVDNVLWTFSYTDD